VVGLWLGMERCDGALKRIVDEIEMVVVGESCEEWRKTVRAYLQLTSVQVFVSTGLGTFFFY